MLNIVLSTSALQDLDWLIDAIQNNGAPLYGTGPVITISTDASTQGWGPCVKVTGHVDSGLPVNHASKTNHQLLRTQGCGVRSACI